MRMKVPFELEPQFDSFHTGMQQMVRRVRREMHRPGAGGGQKGGFMESIFFPKGGKLDQFMGRDVRQSFDQMFRSMGQAMRTNSRKLSSNMRTISKPFDQLMKNADKFGKIMKKSTRGVVGTFKVIAAEARGLYKIIERNTKSLQNLVRTSARMGVRGIGKVGGALGRGAGRVAGAVGRGLTFAGMMGAGGIAGFVTSAYREGIAAYEAREQARLAQAPYLMQGPKGRVSMASGVSLGYNAAQAAQIQGMAGRQGMGSSAMAGRYAMQLMRGYGQETFDFGAGMMRRERMQGTSGLRAMATEIKRVFGAAVASGLDESRMPEFMKASNDYAEKQLAITPDKSSMRDYVKQLAYVQTGGKGLHGKYGAAALNQIDSAIKGAGGAQQSFLMRAFGFGRGASYLDVVRRQEAGVGDAKNLPAIMQQLQSEYGAGKFGGLSARGLLAFKGMGFGSTSMAEKFGKLYLQGGATGMSQKEQKAKIEKIMAGDKDKQLAPIQRRAYQAMGNFGSVAKNLAKRFDQFANLGKEWYNIKKNIVDASIVAAKAMSPILERSVKGISEAVKNFFQKNGPAINKALNKIIDYLARFTAGIGGFFKGFSSSKAGSGMSGFMTRMLAGSKAASAAWENTTIAQNKRDSSVWGKNYGVLAEKLRGLAMGGKIGISDRQKIIQALGEYDEVQKGKVGYSDEQREKLMQGLLAIARKFAAELKQQDNKTHNTSPSKSKRDMKRVRSKR